MYKENVAPEPVLNFVPSKSGALFDLSTVRGYLFLGGQDHVRNDN